MSKISHLKGVLAVVFALIAVGICYAGWRNFDNSNKLKNQDDTLIEPIKTNKSNTSEIDTSGWKTFRHDEYRLEVKYPENMTVSGPQVYESDGVTVKKSLFSLLIRDKKYKEPVEGELPGLIIADYSWGSPSKQMSLFRREDTVNGEISIKFQENGQRLTAKCFLSGDVDMVELCNQILSTLQFRNL